MNSEKKSSIDLSNSKRILNQVKNRVLNLSPTVQDGLERECNKDDFEDVDERALGKGGFGQVWKKKHKLTGKHYAIKVINKEYIIKNKLVDQINREIEIMYRTDHPHIIKLYNHFEDDENFYLIMHCASKGQLYSLLKRVRRMDERTTCQYLTELISAIKYLHSLNPPIIHRDIKPENILLDSDGRVKLADFGWSNFQDENKQRETYCGTPEYLSPEMVTKSGHDESVDIWSIGVLMFELMAGRAPFVYKGDVAGLYNDIKNLKITWTDDFPVLARNLVSKILRLKPSERPSLDEILQHPWFSNTQIFKPVLVANTYDPESKLRSHLIHFQPDNKAQESELKQKLLERRISIKKGDNDSNQQNKNLLEKEVLQNELIQKMEKELKVSKDENLRKDKIIDELKQKIEKFSNDETALKIKDQERLSFLGELELKNKRLMEVESELKLIKSEFSQLDKQLRTTKEALDETQLKNIQLDKDVKDLILKLNKLDGDSKQEIMNLEMKLRISEMNYVQDAKSIGKANDGYDPDKILVLTNGYLNELVEMVKNKFVKVEEKIINYEKAECEFRESLSSQIDKKINDMVENFKETQSRIVTEEKNFFKKQMEDASNKHQTYSKSVEWYKTQVAELHTFKQKYTQDEYLLEKLKKELEIKGQSFDILFEKNKLLEEILKNQNEEIEKLKNLKEKFKNAFLDSENIFGKYVKNKNLRELLNLKGRFEDC